MKLLIEPINGRDIPGYFLRTQEQAASIIGVVGSDRVGLQFDIYHCQTAQGGVTRRLQAAFPLIAHMQIADVPGRHEPGTGELGWEFLFGRIRELGYEGWIGCEYTPKGDTLAGPNGVFWDDWLIVACNHHPERRVEPVVPHTHLDTRDVAGACGPMLGITKQSAASGGAHMHRRAALPSGCWNPCQ